MELAMAGVLTVASVIGIASAPALLGRPRLRTLAMAFATGTLLAILTSHILPEALQLGGQGAGLALLVGFIGMMVVHQHVLKSDPCCDHDHVQHAGLPSFLALAICSLNDGILMLGDRELGLAAPTLWAVAVHKTTSAFALFLLLREVSNQKPIVRWTYLSIFVLVSPLTFVVAGHLGFIEPLLPYVLGLAGGALLYVVAGSMVPKVEHLARGLMIPVLASFLAAAALTVGAQQLAPHSHSDSHEHR